MPTTIKLDMKPTDTIIKRLNLEQAGKAQTYLTSEADRRMYKYVPYLEGGLRGDFGDVEVDKTSITYEREYARKQYYTNKGRGIRGKEWDKKMISAEGDTLVADLQKYVDGGCK